MDTLFSAIVALQAAFGGVLTAVSLAALIVELPDRGWWRARYLFGMAVVLLAAAEMRTVIYAKDSAVERAESACSGKTEPAETIPAFQTM